MGLLCLSRKVGEKILIGADGDPQQIEIVVVEFKGNEVRLGINAPRDIPIFRKELVNQGEATRLGKVGLIRSLKLRSRDAC